MQILENENISNIDDAKVVQPLAKRKLVLVQINSPSLKKFRAMLSEEYPIIDVDSEKEALQLVDKQHDNISAVLFNVELCKQSDFWLQLVDAHVVSHLRGLQHVDTWGPHLHGYNM